MSSGIGAHTYAETRFVELADAEGRLVLIPLVTLKALQEAGKASLTLTVHLERPETSYLSLADAARLHKDDMDDMTFEKARTRIRRAIDRGDISTVDVAGSRRISRGSLSEWRIQARDRNLDDLDDL